MRMIMTVAALSIISLTSGCGGEKGTGNSTAIQMKDLETVDGTINDAMTDLDGVQAESTAVVNSGNESAATRTTSAPHNATQASPPEEDTEVVADQ
ncbi:MAG: hypothetical protein E2598_12955 [Sphingobium sp.]|nr:hypothetical protein [Sphingobium sp.]